MSSIIVINARHHNLKNISCELPKNSLIVFTGPSGSGKSTLAMDVLYAEGQRRYIDSLPSYARQFLGMPDKPDVESISGLCPAIAIDQKTASTSSRSTVGTVTEIYEYLRVIFATVGTPVCTRCKVPIKAASPEILANIVFENAQDQTIIIAVPLAVNQKGEIKNTLSECVSKGYKRFFVNGNLLVLRTEEDVQKLSMPKSQRHSVDLVLEEVEVVPSSRSVIVEAVVKALQSSLKLCKIYYKDKVETYSPEQVCVSCNTSFVAIDARLFSFNSPLGACTQCKGLGFVWNNYFENPEYLEGHSSYSCQKCHGSRLNEYALSVLIEEKNIYEIASMDINEIIAFMKKAEKNLSQHQKTITERLFKEFFSRLTFLNNVGLEYLTLSRPSATLSGGEAQRIRLATQIGSGLSGILYVLDEPSIGLHQRDNDKLIAMLHYLKKLENTIVVVEHDRDTMLSADYIFDIGPGSGKHGGTIVSHGTPEAIIKDPHSITGLYLSGKKSLKKMRPALKPKSFLMLRGAKKNNLQNITVEFPLGVLCGVAGVSGSGKSSLVMGELTEEMKKIVEFRGRQKSRVYTENTKLEGHETIRDIVLIDQKPIGRTPRSNPATYLGIFDYIRQLYASLPESKARGYNQGTFSFNVGIGRCKECAGRGIKIISMHLLPDVTITCDICKGSGYTKDVLDITYKGKHIADILAMTVEEALVFFENHKTIAKKIRMLADVGLTYITLGQSASTLSGGESQRIKLADELSKYGSETLYVLDEPTTGLHFQDIEKLLQVLDSLVQKGNSVIIIEHNIEVLSYMDYLIELGPHGGKHGGTVVDVGTPEHLAKNTKSPTGPYIKTFLSLP